jgi:hypothetical protein
MDTAAKRPGPHGRAATPRTTMYPDTREALRDFKTRKSYPLPMIMILARTTRLRGFQLDRTDFAEGHKFSIAASQYLCELIVKSTVGVYILISLIGQRSQCWRQETTSSRRWSQIVPPKLRACLPWWTLSFLSLFPTATRRFARLNSTLHSSRTAHSSLYRFPIILE